jgi:peptidoglycan hydrolase-like protein with peptidoglycan-binding domain
LVGLVLAFAMTLGLAQPAGALPAWPQLQSGSTGPNVTSAQYLLRQHGHGIAADGDFGPATTSAVRAFQQSRGLAVDGIIGPQTWGALIVTVRNGSSGEAVRAAQTALRKHGHGVAVDGAFGPATESAVRAVQSANGIGVDGVVGPQTWQVLIGGTGGGGGGSFSLPLPRSALPRSEYDDPHHDYPAIDLPVGTGTASYAVRAGVAYRVNDSSCGLGYRLNGDDGAVYIYCHFSAQSVGNGVRVSAGTRLGSTGNTGNSTGPHLHFGIRTGSTNRCPQNFLLALYDGVTPPAATSLPTSGCFY